MPNTPELADHSAGDIALLQGLELAIFRCAGGPEKFRAGVPALLRRAIDEVIDSRRSGRFTLAEIEKTEKTYIGTKVEILLRNFLKVEHGDLLDLKIDGMEVDVKNTIGAQWTIPVEALGHPCILIRANERSAQCWFGILRIREEFLNQGRNRDQKRTLSELGRQNVRWMLKQSPYPPNFWEGLPRETRTAITSPRGGTDRVAALFRLTLEKPIARGIVEAIAQQDDYMKRIRKNGGARDVLARENIAVLWGRNDRDLIAALGLPPCAGDEFVSIKIETAAQHALLKNQGHAD